MRVPPPALPSPTVVLSNDVERPRVMRRTNAARALSAHAGRLDGPRALSCVVRHGQTPRASASPPAPSHPGVSDVSGPSLQRTCWGLPQWSEMLHHRGGRRRRDKGEASQRGRCHAPSPPPGRRTLGHHTRHAPPSVRRSDMPFASTAPLTAQAVSGVSIVFLHSFTFLRDVSIRNTETPKQEAGGEGRGCDAAGVEVWRPDDAPPPLTLPPSAAGQTCPPSSAATAPKAWPFQCFGCFGFLHCFCSTLSLLLGDFPTVRNTETRGRKREGRRGLPTRRPPAPPPRASPKSDLPSVLRRDGGERRPGRFGVSDVSGSSIVFLHSLSFAEGLSNCPKHQHRNKRKEEKGREASALLACARPAEAPRGPSAPVATQTCLSSPLATHWPGRFGFECFGVPPCFLHSLSLLGGLSNPPKHRNTETRERGRNGERTGTQRSWQCCHQLPTVRAQPPHMPRATPFLPPRRQNNPSPSPSRRRRPWPFRCFGCFGVLHCFPPLSLPVGGLPTLQNT